MKRAHLNMYLLLAMSLCISGCFEQAPPSGFEAVKPAEQDPMRLGCPNLIDTYRLSSAQEHNRLLKEPINGKDYSYFIISSLVADQAYNYSLRMDRNHFISKAQELKNSDPEKYFHWRENAVRLSKTYSAKNLADVLQYGSAYEQQGQFHVYGCNKGWVKIQEIETSTTDTKSEQSFIKQDDVWLARDKYGNLLIHTISYQQKPGWTFWAAGGAGTRLIPINDQWDKIKKASDANFAMSWTEADLPTTTKPVHDASECHLSENDIINLNQNLIQSGLTIEQFSLNRSTIKDGACTQASILIGFTSSNSAQANSSIKALEKDPTVDNVEILETRSDNEKLHYQVQVNLRAVE